MSRPDSPVAVSPYYICPTRVPDEQVRRFAAVLTELIQPIAVYLLRYTDPVWQRDTYHDLLFCTSYLPKIPPRDSVALLELFSQHHPRIGFSVLPVGSVEKLLKAGAFYYRAFCSPGNLVWRQPGRQINWPAAAMNITQVQHRFKEDLRKAQAFLQGAGPYRSAGRYDLSVFMLQQATELSGRAVYQALAGQDLKTHQLSVLLRKLMIVAGPLYRLFPGDTAEERRLVQLLDDAYLQARYGDEFIVSAAELTVLENRVHQWLDVAQELVTELAR